MIRSVVCTGSPLCPARERLLCESCRPANIPGTPGTPGTPHINRASFSISRAIRAPFSPGIKSLTRNTRNICLFDGIGEEKQPDQDRRISRARSKGRRSA